MTSEQLKAKYLLLKKEVEDVRSFQSMYHIKRYWAIQVEKYKTYEAYKKALTNEASANHQTDTKNKNQT